MHRFSYHAFLIGIVLAAALAATGCSHAGQPTSEMPPTVSAAQTAEDSGELTSAATSDSMSAVSDCASQPQTVNPLSVDFFNALPNLFADKIEQVFMTNHAVFVQSGGALWAVIGGEPQRIMDTVSGLSSGNCGIYALPNGYAVLQVAAGDAASDALELASGIRGSQATLDILNADFETKQHLNLSELPEHTSSLGSPWNTVVSQDGTLLACSYGGHASPSIEIEIYRLEDGSSQMIDLSSKVQEKGLKLGSIEALSFSADGQKLLFVGSGAASGVAALIYGDLSLNGDCNVYQPQGIPPAQLVPNQSHALPSALFLAEDPLKMDGRCLFVDGTTASEQVLSFSTPNESNLLFPSSDGKYLGTINSEPSSEVYTARIYDRSGNMLCVSEKQLSTEILHSPVLLILSDARICVAILEGGMAEKATQIIAWQF